MSKCIQCKKLISPEESERNVGLCDTCQLHRELLEDLAEGLGYDPFKHGI